MTAANQEIVEVFLSDGSSVKCTPDHRFMTMRGWVEARDLVGEVCENVSHCIAKEAQWSQSFPRQSKNTKASDIISAGNTFRETQSGTCPSGFMSLFGQTFMAWPRQRAITSTIRMRTDQTTIRTISNCLRTASTCLTTILASARFSPRKLCEWQPSGIDPPLVLSGIGNISSKTEVPCSSRGNFHVRNAEPSSQRRPTGTTGFVLTIAKALGAGLRALMMSVRYVCAVALTSQRIDMRSQPHAVASAAVRCVGIAPAGQSDVYCLTVPETEAFAIENGVIVHNCMDMLRYAMMDVDTVASSPKAQTNPFQDVTFG